MHSSQPDQVLFSMTYKDQIARAMLIKCIEQLRYASLTLVDVDGQTLQLGDLDADLHTKIVVNHPQFYQRLLQAGSIGAAEAYIEKWWDTPDLLAVIRILSRNLPTLDKLENQMGWLVKLGHLWRHWQLRNTQFNAKNNIAAHYDLGNTLYRHFLDDNMLYSSGLYLTHEDSLETAQQQKMARLCQQLQLTADDHLLEIGTGWGGLAIYAARHYGCKVTTTTISEQQYQWTKNKIEQQGLSDQITLLKQDYRNLCGEYDKLISIEMIEAVGKNYLKNYIQKCQSLLKPNGLMALQAITIADQRYDQYSNSVDFIQKYIFPGGFLPSVTLLCEKFTQYSDFVVRDLKDLGMDYARTLADWQRRFNHNQLQLQQHGYDERFMRLWQFYLSYCEGGFRERTISAVQILLSRPAWN